MSGMCVNVNDLCTSPSQLQSLAEDLQLTGVEGQTDGNNLPVCTCIVWLCP